MSRELTKLPLILLHNQILELIVINDKRGGLASFRQALINRYIDMKANIVIELASGGGFSCYMKEPMPDYALFGYGNSAQEAKEDMLSAYHEITAMLKEEGKEVAPLEFEYHYDMKSFFDYFNFLNVSKVAERAGINPSLMRKYTSGVAKAGEGQYLKLQKAVRAFAHELQTASF